VHAIVTGNTAPAIAFLPMRVTVSATEYRDTDETSGIAAVYTGVNIGTGGPPSLGTNFSFTSCPIFSAAKSQSTKLVIIDGPSSSVT
jgi:hypothetical protein